MVGQGAFSARGMIRREVCGLVVNVCACEHEMCAHVLCMGKVIESG